MLRALIFFLLTLLLAPVSASSPTTERFKIGVLAYKGKVAAVQRWSEHAAYLNEKLAPLQFQIIPLTYKEDEMTKAVINRQVDFIITNPGHYIELELGGHVSRLATRRMSGPQGVLDLFGGTVIAHPSSTDINRYADLAGKSLLIPPRSSLGGWQVHLREAVAQGVDLREESTVTELKNHTKVVEAVVRGEADAGFVRSDLVEELIAKGKLQWEQFKVVNPQSVTGYPYRLSTRLYPEWPFAKVSGTSTELATQVLQALLVMSPEDAAARQGKIYGWNSPGHYSAVNDLFRETGLGPYAKTHTTLAEILNEYWRQLLSITMLFSLLLLVSTLRTKRANRSLQCEIVERQKVEQKLRQAANVFQYADEGIIIADTTPKIIDVNQAFCRITGFSREEAVGRDPGFMYVDEGVTEDYQNMWEGLLGSGFWSGTVWGLKRSGSVFPQQITITSVVNESKEVEQYVGVFRDITAQKEVERLQFETSKAKDEFLASMSHELRTPLTAIIGHSELLVEQEPDREKRRSLQTIEHAGRIQLALVNDILDISKLESGKFTVDEAPYNVSTLIHNIEQMFSIQAHDKGLFLKVVQQIPESHLLLGDKHRVQQILINLISNAIKFTEQGGVTLSIWHVDGQIHFKVKDSGIGIPSETVEQVFKRFEQADSSISRRFGGSGLGLYISINLAKLMGGDIRVESIEGEGSQFQLNLPYKVSTLPAEAHANQYDNEGRSPVESLHGNLLVAEDTLELQILERRMLESMGFTVAIAENGLKAVELASTQPFDAVLMDMQMPVMDGIEATQNIRQQHPELPIIAVTANVMQKHRDAFHAAGCSGFISKPIDRNVLRETLTEMLKL